MENFDRKSHWETVYTTKQLEEVSWYEPQPKTSLDLIEKHAVSKEDRIIDMGGGDSFLVDHLLDLGYTNVTVLDVSSNAIERAKKRLGDRSGEVIWLVADAAAFVPSETYDIWHDRAAFHFLTQKNEITSYVDASNEGLANDGTLLLGTFSENGPLKCSGIEIEQYSEEKMNTTFSTYFENRECFTTNHPTPFGTTQNFRFCAFKKHYR